MASLPQALPEAGPAPRPAPLAIQHVRRRRRPSGEPPPLPRHLNASGKWWLALSGGVVVAWVVVWATGSVSLFDMAATRIPQALSRTRSPPLTRVALVTGALAIPVAVYVLWVANFLVL